MFNNLLALTLGRLIGIAATGLPILVFAVAIKLLH